MVNALEDVSSSYPASCARCCCCREAESGQVVLQKTTFDLGDVAEDIVDQFQIPAEERHVRLTARIEPGIAIPADRTQIERLLSNLLSNAIKYTPARAARFRCASAGTKRQNWGRIEIRSIRAWAFRQENLPHIFDRFYRVRNAQTNLIQGLGLGLSFVAWIVKAHGGQVDVTSTVGAGHQVHDPSAGGSRYRRSRLSEDHCCYRGRVAELGLNAHDYTATLGLTWPWISLKASAKMSSS